jgi:hypothetical protein
MEYPSYMKAVTLLIFSLLSFYSFSSPYIDKNDEKIKSMASDPYWKSLAHYQKKSDESYESYIASDTFFNSDAGKTDPLKELQSTIRAFYLPIGDDQNDHPQCKFIARFKWINSKIDLLNDKSLPIVECDKFNKWVNEKKIDSISIMFASGYMSNPASLYGHMLLKINRDGNNPLLDYSLNFGAIVPDDEGAITYIAKGIFGGYKAAYSDQLYYRHQHNYGETELRDIWSYKLNLSQKEKMKLVSHVWELMGQKFDYFFIDENCAFHIAQLIELATEVDLTSNLSPWVMPITVFDKLMSSTHNNKPIVSDVELTPSRQTLFYRYFDTLPDKLKITAKNLAEGLIDFKHISYGLLIENEKKSILEVLLQYSEFLILSDHNSEAAAVFKRKVLKQRMRLSIGKEISIANFKKEPPHKAGMPTKTSFGIKKNQITGNSLNLGFRLTYFDTLASNIARIPNSNLEMLDIEIEANDDKIFINKFDLIDIQSLSPSYTGWKGDKPLSWGIRLGYELETNDCKNCGIYIAEGDVGKSWLVNKYIFGYALIGGRLQAGYGDFNGISGTLKTGAIISINEGLKSKIEIVNRYKAHGNTAQYKPEISWELKYNINRALELRAGILHKQTNSSFIKINYYWH